MEEKYDSLKIQNQLCFPLYACSKEIIKRYKPMLDKLDLTYTQYIVMMVMWEQKEINVKKLGECLFLDSGTLTPLLKKLENKGYISRKRSTDDERNLIISITDKGMKLRLKAKDVPMKMGKCINLSKDEAMQLYKTLYKILEVLKEEEKMYDVIIIGAGPAGVSAGLYAKRANKNVLILYYGTSNLEKATDIDNYYGFEKGISGKELYNNGIKQAENLKIDVRKEEVLNIEKINNDFIIKTTENEYNSKTVIIATGNKKLRPNIKGISEFEGKGISYCAICDGFFYRNKNVAVIGNGKFALNEANDLKQIANSITILTDGLEMQENTDFNVNNKKIKEIHGENKVTFVEFEDSSKLEIDGIFIALGEAGGSSFAKKMGVMTNGDNIKVNEKMETNIPGLYSCGNATGGLLQVCKAVYEGAEAGLSAINFINRKESD